MSEFRRKLLSEKDTIDENVLFDIEFDSMTPIEKVSGKQLSINPNNWSTTYNCLYKPANNSNPGLSLNLSDFPVLYNFLKNLSENQSYKCTFRSDYTNTSSFNIVYFGLYNNNSMLTYLSWWNGVRGDVYQNGFVDCTIQYNNSNNRTISTYQNGLTKMSYKYTTYNKLLYNGKNSNILRIVDTTYSDQRSGQFYLKSMKIEKI